MRSIPRSPPTTASPSIPPFPSRGRSPVSRYPHTECNKRYETLPVTQCPRERGTPLRGPDRASRVALAGRVSHIVPGNGGTVPPFRLQLLFLKTSADPEISNDYLKLKDIFLDCISYNDDDKVWKDLTDHIWEERKNRRNTKHRFEKKTEHLLGIYYFQIINSLKKGKGKTLSDT